MNTVQVYVLGAPYFADKQYEYYLPPDLREAAKPGVLVEVPFGSGNRHMTGVIWSMETGEQTRRLKPVLAVLNDTPVLSPEMLALAAFLRDHTLCTYGDAVRAMVPTAALARIYTYFVPGETFLAEPEAVLFRKETGEATEGAVLRFVWENRRVTREAIYRKFNADCSASILHLTKEGLIKKEYVTKQASAPKRRTVAFLCRGEAPFPVIRGKSKNYSLIYGELEQHGPGDIDELAARCGLERSVVRRAVTALKRQGLLETREEEAYRNPFALPEDAQPMKPEERPPLSDEQRIAYLHILRLYETGLPKAALLHGVTGSGKTNVIMAAIDRVLEDGRGVIMLVPEIALTPQTVSRFAARYGGRIAVIHSGLSAGERYDAWRRIKEGHADVVIGTRSAIFAPLPRIGMVIIDEEHEYTYKSDANPKYHAHDVARFRCREHNAVMLLSSATPSVASYYKAQTGAYTLIEMKERYGGAKLPEVVIADMRGSGQMIGKTLMDRLLLERQAGNQAILFLNRRGYSNYVSCRSCGKAIRCPHCSVTLTYHRLTSMETAMRAEAREEEGGGAREDFAENGYLTCHLCGHTERVPDKCPSCGASHLMYMGYGTQKAEDALSAGLDGFRVIRMDLDTTQGKFAHEELLSRFRAGEADILLGTQMVTKGHDFPNVSTVGVLNADGAMFLDDYRASERLFALLTQVVGRAGRGDIPGCAIIQTYEPDNEVLRLAAEQNYEAFYRGEIRLRRALCFPPFCDLAVLTLSSENELLLQQTAARMKEQILAHIRTDFKDVPLVVYGPFEAPVYRVQNICRMRYVFKCRLNRRTRDFLAALMREFSQAETDRRTGRSVRISVSVDLNPSTV